MIDVQQIALALRACTRQSLIIIDEFGKGTEAQGRPPSQLTDGRWCWFILCCVGAFPQITKATTESIDGNIFEDILIIGNSLSRYVITVTTNVEILQGGFIENTPYLQYMHMEVCLPDETNKQSNEVIFLYK